MNRRSLLKGLGLAGLFPIAAQTNTLEASKEIKEITTPKAIGVKYDFSDCKSRILINSSGALPRYYTKWSDLI